VANFGAFIDIGVHQDGLVHISQLSHQFVDDPHKVVKVGQIVQVKVLEVDIPRSRISLTMKLEERANQNVRPQSKPAQQQKPQKKAKAPEKSTSLLAEQLMKAFK